MNSLNLSKKVERKLKKLQYVVFKEAGVNCDLNPTKNIVICNAGLVNGLSEEIICEHFLQHGSIDKILLLPGKSCGFVSYKNVSSATNAFDNFNELPEVKSVKSWNELPPGLTIFENFISFDEELELLNLCDFKTGTSHMKNRQVKHYGYEFRYDTNNVDKEKPLKEPIPGKCNFLWDQLYNKYNLNFHPNQLTINYYSPGQGIPQHVDTHSAFEDPIISLSLLSPVVMEFKKEDKHLCVLLPRRSLAVISGESRYDWSHGISPRKFDIIYLDNNFTTLERGTRISYTFRKILQSECNCKYISKCDSYNRQQRKAIIENAAASELEKLHVHNVYENIASHFSNTRHKPWPRVVEFLQSFNPGSILLDVGCGNGKYLGQSNNCFDIGCDQSSELINVCKNRGFEVFTSNCLNLPLKSNIADGAISIAVIHHLSTEERRLQALREMVRVLKIGGRALIYVWAKDQCKDEELSSYIKQDRKNRKNQKNGSLVSSDDQVLNVLNGVTLPVHSNRTQFKHSDLLVPWKLKTQDESNQMFLRFYHVFQENELNQLCQKLNSLEILHNYYDQGNWCVVIKKIK